MKKYQRSGVVETLRRFCRIADLVLFLIVQRMRGRLPPFSALQKTTLVELGPGPTRLEWLKGLLFRRVFFVDQSDFGIPSLNLRIANLEGIQDATIIARDLCGLSTEEPVLLFGDHCMEHLSRSTVLAILNSAIENGFSVCFRVPNVLSPLGRQNFLNDPTHQASFDLRLRDRIQEFGFAIFPWMRWYRPDLIFKTLILGKQLMTQAEEIAICTCHRCAAN